MDGRLEGVSFFDVIGRGVGHGRRWDVLAVGCGKVFWKNGKMWEKMLEMGCGMGYNVSILTTDWTPLLGKIQFSRIAIIIGVTRPVSLSLGVISGSTDNGVHSWRLSDFCN